MKTNTFTGIICAGLVALTAGIAAQQQAQTPQPPPATASVVEVDAFAKSLEACAPGAISTPHPLMKSFIVEHQISGATKDRCAYSQTMPGRMKMICALSGDGRKALGTDLRAMAAGSSLKGSTSGPAPVWMKECEIEMPDGKRIPAGK